MVNVPIARFLAEVQAQPDYAGQIAHVRELPPQEATFGELDRPLPLALEQAVRQTGIERLYSHQAEAINASRRREHVMLATGTASGKTLCYNIPVFEALLADPMSRALYLFPTKALAQDQLRALGQLSTGMPEPVRYGAYDGDTPVPTRSRLRRQAGVLLTNPDMLSMGILPNHASWTTFLRHLRFVVVDEAHTYRGIFGSHVALVLRRLRRLCRRYGAEPQFIFCSATIANPDEHAERLCGTAVTVVDRDGAPHGPRQFALWNPISPDDPAHSHRPNTDAAMLLTALLREELPTIAFVRARRVAELILRYVREELRREPELAARISAYRAGYLPEQRREIERRLFSGELLAVVSTTALELGIDVGDIAAALLVGYPGTIASVWQQAGRAGRGRAPALSVLIAQDDPLDQYLMRHPEALFGRAPEHALTDPANPYLLRDHLLCAAYEWPLSNDDANLFGPALGPAVAALAREGELELREDRWVYPYDDYPAERVNLRSSEGPPIVLADETNALAPLEEIDAATAPLRVYPGAIYYHQGDAWRITRLDLQGGLALARPETDAPYYTQPQEIGELDIIRSQQMREMHTCTLYLGQVRVTNQVIGYERRHLYDSSVLGREPLDLPPTSFETQALWFDVPAEMQRVVTAESLDVPGGLHAVEHACIALLPLLAMCDRNDIGGLSTERHHDTGLAQVFIYDGHPGGVGLAEKGFALIEQLWEMAIRHVQECPCEAGCPSCIHSPKCGNGNEPLDKRAAIRLFELLLG